MLSHSDSDSATQRTAAPQAPLSVGIPQERVLEWGTMLSSRGSVLPNPGTEPWSPALQAYSLPSVPPGKSKNPEVGSPSLLQGNFLTQGSNQSLLHCRRILFHLSYLGSPKMWMLLLLLPLSHFSRVRLCAAP